MYQYQLIMTPGWKLMMEKHKNGDKMEIKELENTICIGGLIIILLLSMYLQILDNQIVLVGLGILGGFIGGKTLSQPPQI